jgi:hypothetical protein
MCSISLYCIAILRAISGVITIFTNVLQGGLRWIELLLHLGIDIWSWMAHYIRVASRRNLRLSLPKDFCCSNPLFWSSSCSFLQNVQCTVDKCHIIGRTILRHVCIFSEKPNLPFVGAVCSPPGTRDKQNYFCRHFLLVRGRAERGRVYYFLFVLGPRGTLFCVCTFGKRCQERKRVKCYPATSIFCTGLIHTRWKFKNCKDFIMDYRRKF